MNSEEPDISVVSAKGVLVVILLVLAAWYLILPDRGKTIERLEKDGQFERALEVIGDWESGLSGEPSLELTMIKLRLMRKKALVNDSPEQLVDVVDLGLKALRDWEGNERVIKGLIQTVQSLPDPRVAVGKIMPVIEDSDFDLAETFWITLSELAQARGEVVLAAELRSQHLREGLKRWGNDSEELFEAVEKTVVLWRLAGKPSKGYDELNRALVVPSKWLLKNRFSLFALKVTLLREVGRAVEAYETLMEAADEQGQLVIGDDILEEELASLLTITARESGNEAKLIPIYEAQLKTQPNNVELMLRLARLYVATEQFDQGIALHLRALEAEPETLSYRRELAQSLEWAGRPEEAFKHHLILAKAMDERSLERIRSLAPGLHQLWAYADVLNLWAPFDPGSDWHGEWALTLVRLGRYAEAISVLEAFLTVDPIHLESLKLLGPLYTTMNQFEKAANIYQQWLHLDPSAAVPLRKLAKAKWSQGELEAAYEVYREYLFDRLNYDADAVREFLLLCSSMGRPIDYAATMRFEMSQKVDVLLGDYLTLGNHLKSFGAYEDAVDTFREGLRRFPNNRDLELNLARLFGERTEYVEARKVLEASRSLSSDNQLAGLYLDVLLAQGDLETALDFDENSLSTAIRREDDIAETLGHIYLNAERYRESRLIFADLSERQPDNPDFVLGLTGALMGLGETKEAAARLRPFLRNPEAKVLKLAAVVSVAGKDYEAAENYQLRYLDAVDRPSHLDWGFLGDIRMQRGANKLAKGDYERALLNMLQSVASPAAFVR